MSSKLARKDSVLNCVVCTEDVEVFAIGACDHHVCYKCCVRMRVLGKETYCPVCRTELLEVFMTKDNTSFEKLSAKRSSSYIIDKRQGIFYQKKEIQLKVKELLEHRCPICPDRAPDRYFDRLRDHMRREHERYFCDLCVAHLQKFSCELKVYTRPELARHRRVGDADDKSHKGHPLCEFCDQRYLDNDELHKHLRKDHFWCHFCERDGSQDYYPDYEHLRVHFRDFHFLCEEEDCIHEQFTSVFRTKVDLQAHRAAKHSGKLSKAQARQARQLDVNITFAPRPRPQSNQVTGRDYTEVRASEQGKGKREKSGNQGHVSLTSRKEALELQTAMAHSLNELSEDPSQLPSPSSQPQDPKKSKPEEKNTAGDLPSKEDQVMEHFPALLGSLEVTNVAEVSKNNKKSSEPPLFAKASIAAKLQSVDEFPTLGASARIPEQSPSIPPGFAAAARQASAPAVSQQTYRAKPPPGFQPKEKVKENVAPVQEVPVSKAETKNNSSVQERNQALVEKIRGLLGNDKSKFDEFKALSGKFRQSACSAKEYYAHCCELFGSNFSQVFTELVDLLPDPERQKELMVAHQDAKIISKQKDDKKKGGKANKKPPLPGAWQSGATAWNAETKDNGVSERDFPSLPAATRTSYQPRYKAPKSATVLKEAWIRGK